RCRHPSKWRPEQGKRKTGLLVTLEVVSDLLRRARHRWRQLPFGSLIGLRSRDIEEEHARDFQIVDRAQTPGRGELLFDRRAPALDLVGGILDSDPAGQTVFGDPLRRNLGHPEPSKKDRRMRLLHRLHPEAAFRKRRELAVILKELLGPDTLHYLDCLD